MLDSLLDSLLDHIGESTSSVRPIVAEVAPLSSHTLHVSKPNPSSCGRGCPRIHSMHTTFDYDIAEPPTPEGPGSHSGMEVRMRDRITELSPDVQDP